jgi:hypothetical protein
MGLAPVGTGGIAGAGRISFRACVTSEVTPQVQRGRIFEKCENILGDG